MLPQTFFDWWFSPWSYACEVPFDTDFGSKELARRDAYRLWCARADVSADFPARFDPSWHVAASTSGDAVRAAARLFAALVLIRQNDRAPLLELSPDEQQWCTRIAATQPLRTYAEMQCSAGAGLELRGLVEFGCRLESRFPGMWSRLRLLLPLDMRHEIQGHLNSMIERPDETDAAAMRGLRCWRLCYERARAVAEGPVPEEALAMESDAAVDEGRMA